MEKFSHSLPRKTYNADAFAGKTVYDDVFGGPPKFGLPTLYPRDEDYTESFQGFHAYRGSSIPILDLPVIEDDTFDIFFDVGSSKFDYSEVFGGIEFADSYEELFIQSNNGDDTSDEVWTPAQSESLSDESDPSVCSRKDQSLSNGDLYQSIDSTKQFHKSCQKSNQIFQEDMQNGMTQVNGIDTPPRYNFAVNKNLPARKIEDVNSHLWVTNDISLNTDLGGGTMEGKRLRKTMSHPPNRGLGLQAYESKLNHLNGHDTSDSSRKTFLSVYDISLTTHPSHVPPPSRPPPGFAGREESSSRLNLKLKASKSYAFERMTCDTSPPFFDVEIDASTSSAPLKDAEQKAQEKLKSAKQLMERKNGERVQEKYERNTTQVVSGVMQEEHINIARNSYTSSQGSHKLDGTIAWREATQFYKNVEDNQVKDEIILAQHIKSHDYGQKEKGIMEIFELQEYNMNIKSSGVNHVWEENGNQCEVPWQHFESKGKHIATKGSYRQEEHQENLNFARKVYKLKGFDKKTSVAPLHGETQKLIKGFNKCEEVENLIDDQLKENEVQSKQKLKKCNESMEFAKNMEEAHESKESTKKSIETFDSKENERKLKEDVERVENEKTVKETLVQDAIQKQEKEAHDREGNAMKQETSCERGDNENKREESFQSEGMEKRSKEALEMDENVKIQEKAYEGRESRKKLNEDPKKAGTEKRFKQDTKQEESKKLLQEANKSGENEKRGSFTLKKEGAEERSKVVGEKEKCKNRIKDYHNREGFTGQHRSYEQVERDGIDRKLNLNEGISVSIKGLIPSDGVRSLGETKTPQETRGDGEQDKFYGKLRTEPKNCKRESEASSGMDQSGLQHEYTNIRIGSANGSLNLLESVANPNEDGIGIEVIHTERNKGASENAGTEITYMLGHNQGEGRKNIEGLAFDREGNRDQCMSSQAVKGWVENVRKVGDVLPALFDSKGNTQNKVHKFTSQSLGRKEKNLTEKLTLEERDIEERLKRDIELEKNRLRNIEKERRRERREKDQMAVDTAIHETHKRAFAEASERTERVATQRETAEVRQRVLAEARERLDKASAEGREKLTVSADVRLRAECSAVERATAEARERAAEKAIAEKTSFWACEQADRSLDGKLYASSRQGGLKQSSSTSDMLDSLNQNSRSSGLEVESSQRCKARLERHRRTAERAAKALAEKKMRDLLVQREQAERIRIAEALDADVKRWSGGKEGNVRALLSTLQYILGPDSGWKPIPLTDVITAGGVKKAYRQAIRCVHPDKLQQRSASIQQKYICEKVFDLLKEAWKRFNSEEW